MVFGVIFFVGDAADVQFTSLFSKFNLLQTFGTAGALFVGEAIEAFGAADAFFIVLGFFVFGA